MGICGTAMGNAALLARAAGHEVSGADAGVYPPMSDVLAEAGITVHEGYDAERLAQLAPDLVVVGNAMSRGNPEVEWLLESRALRFTSLPALLAETVLAGRRNLVICGTHGKTTTTSMTAFLLRENGCDPGFLIGGVPLDPPVGQHLGALDDPFVIEGDEYDSAFFDKRSKFIHYAPHIAVLNNLEFDHADIFRDLVDVERTFRHLTRIVPRNGFVLLNGDDANLAKLDDMPWTQVLRVGVGEHNDVRIVDFAESGTGASFGLQWRGRDWGRVEWVIAGLFNARNAAMAATAAGLALNPEDPTVVSLAPLAKFRGVRRRQEIRVQQEKLVVIEDFGHHPTALDQTLRSLRARYPEYVLTAVFEPRSNTARTRALEEPFMHALALADEVYLGAVNRAERLSEAERFNREAVMAYLTGHGTEAHTAETNGKLLVKLEVSTLPGDGKPRVVVFFTNGSFDGIIDAFVKMAAGES
ncbi:UDP-N-acetylmuramate--L-alanine ligase [Actomonas aquatica]|uniref:Mur ligase family protein n=1 Tax=Actomonas aquatica TaxID=2866162 RepID=A0ABZ1CB55_9BACT|nr:Mur ligase family protein [Opitutus sp. WL0086]WRQ88916.1 Mur ligase family protein [Opitutus sp. WL0086]